MSKIVKIYGREVLDSRGNPTVEVEVTTEKGFIGRAIVPSGASTGSHEALELRDNDLNRYLGKGVLQAVLNVNTVIKDKLIGLEVMNQTLIDQTLIQLDGTKDKTNLGANAMLGVSLAVSHAGSLEQQIPLFEHLKKEELYTMPIPMINVLNGGSHADSSVDFQEYMIVPVGANSIHDAIRMGSEVFHHLKQILKSHHEITSVGDEGGFAPHLSSNEEPIVYIIEAILEAGYNPGKDIAIALDVAASEFYNSNTHTYDLVKSKTGSKTTEEMIQFLSYLVDTYPIISIEDGIDENDWEGWQKLTKTLGCKVMLVGDDLFVTNSNLLQKGIDENVANAILIKPNQIGTLTETIEAIKLAQKNHYQTIISHRSGETEDTTIAHLAVAYNTGFIKTGSMSRTERICKYNELMRIEERLGNKAHYPQR